MEEAILGKYLTDTRENFLFTGMFALSNYDLENPDSVLKLNRKKISFLFGSLIGFAWIEETRYGKRYVLQKKSCSKHNG